MLVTVDRMAALVAVIEAGSFSAAARRLGKTPSALSRIIQHFELDLGVDLFVRVEGQAPRPTSTARKLYFQAVEVLPRLEILENSARQSQAGVESKLVLAIHSMAFSERLERILRQFVLEFPAVDLTLLDPDNFGLDKALIDGEIDLVFMPAALVPTRAVSFQRYSVDEWCYVTGSDHPLADRRGELSEADLLPHTQILPGISDVITADMQEAMRICPRHIVCQRLVQILELLRIGLGFACLPRHTIRQGLTGGELVELRVESAQQGLRVWDTEVRWTGLGPAGQWLLDAILEDS